MDHPKYGNEMGILLGNHSSQPSSQPFKDSYPTIFPIYPQLKCQDLICQANDDLDAAIKTVRDMVSSLRLDVDARRRKALRFSATVDCKKQSITNLFISPYIC